MEEFTGGALGFVFQLLKILVVVDKIHEDSSRMWQNVYRQSHSVWQETEGDAFGEKSAVQDDF